MRKFLVLTTLVVTMLALVFSALAGARYVLSPAPVLQVGTLLNLYGRPLVALLVLIVLAARFKDIWKGSVRLDEPCEHRIAGFAQSLGLVLMGGALVLLVGVLTLHFSTSALNRGQLPLFFLFGPLVALMPIGYFVFELGRSIERDRRLVPAE
jgi:hypothetical protein